MTSHSPLDAFQVRGAVVIGTDGYLVGVSAVSSDDHSGLHIEGLAAIDTWTARDRIRAAILNGGLPWPARAVTVSLTPVRMPTTVQRICPARNNAMNGGRSSRPIVR